MDTSSAVSTQLEAWRIINANGILKTRRLEVFNLIHQHQPCTQNDVFFASKMMKSTVSGRFKELEDAGYIRRIGKKYCQKTLAPGTLYETTGFHGKVDWKNEETKVSEALHFLWNLFFDPNIVSQYQSDPNNYIDIQSNQMDEIKKAVKSKYKVNL